MLSSLESSILSFSFIARLIFVLTKLYIRSFSCLVNVSFVSRKNLCFVLSIINNARSFEKVCKMTVFTHQGSRNTCLLFMHSSSLLWKSLDFKSMIKSYISLLPMTYSLKAIELITFFRKSVVAWRKVLSTEINPVVWSR